MPTSRESSKAEGSTLIPPSPTTDKPSPNSRHTKEAAAPAAGPAAATSSSVCLHTNGRRFYHTAMLGCLSKAASAMYLLDTVFLSLVMDPKLPSKPRPAGMKKGSDRSTPLLFAAHL